MRRIKAGGGYIMIENGSGPAQPALAGKDEWR
jgi:hypothetical protein